MMELKPCPFCGEPLRKKHSIVSRENLDWVRCRKCKGEGPCADTIDGAITEWNRRALPDSPSPEDVEKLIKAVWAAGFRTGHTSGSDDAICFDAWGARSTEPQDPDAAWKAYVEPWLDPELPWNFMDIFSPTAWEDMP